MKRLVKSFMTGAVCFLFGCAFSLSALAAPAYLWSMDTADEISDYGDDHTGANFQIDNVVFTQGTASCKVTPSGDAAETKLALALENKNLQGFLGKDSLALNVYIPKDMKVKPNVFFLGMADVTSDWKWVDGLFSTTPAVDGWNKIVYPLTAPIKEISEDGRYMIYLSFFAKADDGSKPPLQDAFYIDGMWMEP